MLDINILIYILVGHLLFMLWWVRYVPQRDKIELGIIGLILNLLLFVVTWPIITPIIFASHLL